MSPAEEVQKAKTRLATIGSLARPVLMRWAWIFLRSFMEAQCLSSIDRYGWSKINLLLEVGNGDEICDQQLQAAIFFLWFLFSVRFILLWKQNEMADCETKGNQLTSIDYWVIVIKHTVNFMVISQFLPWIMSSYKINLGWMINHEVQV